MTLAVTFVPFALCATAVLLSALLAFMKRLRITFVPFVIVKRFTTTFALTTAGSTTHLNLLIFCILN